VYSRKVHRQISPPFIVVTSDFGVTCILHVVYLNAESAAKVGHDRSKYTKITLGDPKFMESKEAFIGMVIKGAEELYDRLSRTTGSDRGEDSDADQ